MQIFKLIRIIPLLLSILILTSCQRVLYKDANQKQALIKEVQTGQNSMVRLRQQLESAKKEFDAITNATDGDLRERSNRIQTNYQTSESLAQAIRDNIANIQVAANDYFGSWETELADYSNPELRQESGERLEKMREKYNELKQSLNAVETQLATTLPAFKDRVLFVQHNMTAETNGELDKEIDAVNENISELIEDLQDAVDQSDEFLSEIRLGDAEG